MKPAGRVLVNRESSIGDGWFRLLKRAILWTVYITGRPLERNLKHPKGDNGNVALHHADWSSIVGCGSKLRTPSYKKQGVKWTTMYCRVSEGLSIDESYLKFYGHLIPG